MEPSSNDDDRIGFHLARLDLFPCSAVKKPGNEVDWCGLRTRLLNTDFAHLAGGQ